MSGSAVDWSAVRRAYRGGEGGTLSEIAEQFGLPLGSVHYHSGQEEWRKDSTRPASYNRLRARARQLVRECPDQPVADIRRRLEREFGKDHPAIPSDRTLRWWRPGTRPPTQVPAEDVTLDGLTRICQECFQRTVADPCAHCGTASREVAA